MKYIYSSFILAIAFMMIQIVPTLARQFKQALPGFKFSFPRDHASHEEFKTEWWYYTGHIQTKQGRKFGYELTFFRTGVDLPEVKSSSPWKMKDIYLAHFAISDLQNGKFYFSEKLNRAGVKLAGADENLYRVFNENWSVEALGDKFVLKADTPDFGLHLLLSSGKQPVVHGINGVSQKASCKGCASHYYSMTRLNSEGTLYLKGSPEPVTGISWMDHEFGSNQLTAEQVGWDWYSVQLSNKTELMLYTMRGTKGQIDPNSSGSLVFEDGRCQHLNCSDFQIVGTGSWTSPNTGGHYPMGWRVSVPSQKLNLTIAPALQDQELRTGHSTGVIYWEGACDVTGTMGADKVSGQAYVEMTGYAEKFRKNI